MAIFYPYSVFKLTFNMFRNQVICFLCRAPSSFHYVRLVRCRSFSYCKSKKSGSTVALPGITMSSPLEFLAEFGNFYSNGIHVFVDTNPIDKSERQNAWNSIWGLRLLQAGRLKVWDLSSNCTNLCTSNELSTQWCWSGTILKNFRGYRCTN